MSRKRGALCPECGGDLTVRREGRGAVVVRHARCEECGWLNARVYYPDEVEAAAMPRPSARTARRPPKG